MGTVTREVSSNAIATSTAKRESMMAVLIREKE